MPDKKTVLFVINSLAGGGAERVLTTLLAASEPWRGHYALHLALLDREPEAYAPPAWIKIHQLDARQKLLPSLLQLRALVGTLKPDVTLSFLTRANVANAFAMAGRRRPWLISERVNTSAHLGSGLGSRIARAMVRASYPRANHIIAVSDGVADDLVANFGVQRARVSAIANPVDNQRIGELAQAAPAFVPEGPYVVAAGRLVPNKNFSMLLDAFAMAQLPLRLVILGEGPEREALAYRAKALGIADRVDMPGFIDNPYALLARAALFAMPSNAEGFPNGLVEAMACGLPVVATNCASGPSEILASLPRNAVGSAMDVPAGALVPTDDPRAFADALRAVSAELRRTSAGAAARQRSLAYGVEQAATNYWTIIEGALGPKRHAPDVMPMGEMALNTGVSQ